VIFRQKNLLHAFGTSQGDTTMYQTPQTLLRLNPT